MDGDTAASRVWRTGRAARMDTYEDAEGELAAIMRGYGVRAVVAAPIFLGGSLWGAVIVSVMEPGEPFPEGAEQRIAYFAELAAQALANARRARSWRPRAPASCRRATRSAGGWSATCTTARSSGWCRWR